MDPRQKGRPAKKKRAFGTHDRVSPRFLWPPEFPFRVPLPTGAVGGKTGAAAGTPLRHRQLEDPPEVHFFHGEAGPFARKNGGGAEETDVLWKIKNSLPQICGKLSTLQTSERSLRGVLRVPFFSLQTMLFG